MCGIFGLQSFQESKSEAWFHPRLSSVNRILAHRGPDEQNLYIDPRGRFGLAHQRLAIIDLSSAGRQPMPSHSQKSVIVFNGEIYNFQDLKRSLPQAGYRGHSDTEVLLEGLELKGERFLNELDGMFALGYFDLAQKRFLLATDPAGKKPLYTYWDGKYFAFASEIKAFKQIPELNLETDTDFIKQYLVYGYVPCPNTIYRNIKKVPAGSYLWVSEAEGPGKVQKYWDLPLQPQKYAGSYKEAQSELRYLLSSAVQKRLLADVPVGCFLSGGLDSSAVSFLAANILKPQKLKTFSAAFKSDGALTSYDESRFAQMVADQIKSEHYEINIETKNIDSDFILRQFDEPFADSSAIPTYLLSKQIASHVKVALSGDGGDELFAGYMRFRAGLISSSYAWLLKPMLSPFHFTNAPRRSWRGFLNRFRERLNTSTLEQQLAWNSYFDQEDFKKYLDESASEIYAQALDFDHATQGLDVGQKILYYNFKTYLYDDLLPKVDRMSMAHGLEVRSPFLDKKLIEFAFSLPTHYKMDYLNTKKILKDTFAPDFGKDFVYRKKQGFALPIENFIERQSLNIANIEKALPQFKWNQGLSDGLKQQNSHHKIYLLMSLERNL